MVRKTLLLLCGYAVVGTWLVPVSNGQDAASMHLYGSGVHQYFGGNYSRAYDDLSRAIDNGSQDPRVYYYRGLAQMRMGNEDAAAWDLQMGAQLEGSDLDRVYPVGKALERVQGPTRRTLERYRALARVEASQRQRDHDAVRYDQWKRAESGVLRDPKYVPKPEPVAKPPVPQPPASSESDPFDAEEKAEEKPASRPAPKPAPPAAAEEPADADLAPDAEMPEEAAGADAASEDPFGDDTAEKP